MEIQEAIKKVHEALEGRYDLDGFDLHHIHGLLCEMQQLKEHNEIQELYKLLKKKYQILNWGEWRGFKFIKSNPLKEPAAFHLIYKWSLYIGFWEIRKFMNDEEMKRALEIYRNNLKNIQNEIKN